MLNSYKTLINGIATAVNALKAEVKSGLAAVNSKISDVSKALTDGLATIPVEDDLTIVRDADGKLSTSLNAYERDLDITWDGDTTGLASFKYSNDGDVYTFYHVSDKVITEEVFLDANTTVTSAHTDGDNVDKYDGSDNWFQVVKGGNVLILASMGWVFRTQTFTAVVALEDNAAMSQNGLTITAPKKGIYFPKTEDGEYVKEIRNHKIQMIDEKFLPATPAANTIVNITGIGTTDDPYVADVEYEKVLEGFNNGANIIAFWKKDGNQLCGRLMCCFSSGALFFMAFYDYDGWQLPYEATAAYVLMWTSGGKISSRKRLILNNDCVAQEVSGDLYANYRYVPSVEAVFNAFENLKSDFVLNSSTEGSSKQFKITVDDSGTISATEVTS